GDLNAAIEFAKCQGNPSTCVALEVIFNKEGEKEMDSDKRNEDEVTVPIESAALIKASPDSFYCKLCGFNDETSLLFVRHLGSSLHKKSMETLTAEEKEKTRGQIVSQLVANAVHDRTMIHEQ
ncbi:hypothetical protein PMAYCL1PPCAC_28633, partial [Pristionchus mayeri]